MERAELRKLLAEVAENGKSARYPAELKEAAVAYFRARRADGVEPFDIARELGMVTATLMRWDALQPPTASIGTPTEQRSIRSDAAEREAAPTNLDKRAARFRAKVEAAGIVHGRSYPQELRQEALAYLKARKGDGVPGAVIAEELGVSWEALTRWQSGKPWRRPSREGFRRVEIDKEAERPSTASAILVHVGSLRIEGLDVAALVDVLRRLA